nr:leukocyte-associated immunoglobulin-like receptor 1 isoform X1 [Loxodonta africana]
MSLMPTAFLGLMFCLGPATQAQNGNLPRPSTSAEPGSVIPWQMSVTFVCQGPPGAEVFRLEKNGVPSDINPSPTEACFQTELHGEKLCLVLAGVILLMLVVILAEAWHSKCRSQRGPMEWRQDGASQRF